MTARAALSNRSISNSAISRVRKLVEERVPVIHIPESSGPPFLMKNW
jgi:hypothetical protein